MSKQHAGIRTRKQHFPRTDRRRTFGHVNSTSTALNYECFPSDDDHRYAITSPTHKRINHKSISPCTLPSSSSILPESEDHSKTTIRPEKKARDEHNEQERNRRRELAVIYELIRCSLVPHDLRHLNPDECPRSIDRLSYPQVLHVAYHVLKEEQHNFTLYERALVAVEKLEKEYQKIGLIVPKRPFLPAPMERYRKVVQVVDNLLRLDKNSRTFTGAYEVTPTERAAMGDRQLMYHRPRRHSVYTRNDGSHDEPLGLSSRDLRRPIQRADHRRGGPYVSRTSTIQNHRKSLWSKRMNTLKRSASNDSFVGYPLRQDSQTTTSVLDGFADIPASYPIAELCLPSADRSLLLLHSS